MNVLTHWELGLPVEVVGAAAAVYAVGLRRGVSRSRSRSSDAAWFAAGIFTLVLALASPIAAYDDELFWDHMVQHVLLLTVAPPLLVLARPWTTIARALPPSMRRATLAPAARLARRRRRAIPPLALAFFVVMMLIWHVPALYDATLQNVGIHDLEHALFLASGMALWSQLIDVPPFRTPLGYAARAAYSTVAIAAGTVLSLVLALSSKPFYVGYSDLASRPGGISALNDQQLAAGIMWVPGSLAFSVVLLIAFYRFLDEGGESRYPHEAVS